MLPTAIEPCATSAVPDPRPMPELSAQMEQQRAELAELIRRHAPADGSFQTLIKPLFMVRHDQPPAIGAGAGPTRLVHHGPGSERRDAGRRTVHL